MPAEPTRSRTWILLGWGTFLFLCILGVGVWVALNYREYRSQTADWEHYNRAAMSLLQSDPRFSGTIGVITSTASTASAPRSQDQYGRRTSVIHYTLTGIKGSCSAQVWLNYPPGGPWVASGAILTLLNQPPIRIGNPPELPGSEGKGD